MTSLKEARAKGEIAKFVMEHRRDKGDADAFNATFEAMAGTSKAVPEASCEPLPDDCSDTQTP